MVKQAAPKAKRFLSFKEEEADEAVYTVNLRGEEYDVIVPNVGVTLKLRKVLSAENKDDADSVDNLVEVADSLVDVLFVEEHRDRVKERLNTVGDTFTHMDIFSLISQLQQAHYEEHPENPTM